MKVLYLAAAAALSLALGACASGGGYHDSVKLQAAGVNMSSSTGVTAGYLGATVDRVMNVDKDGKPITVAGGCKADTPDTFANMNSKASANASSVGATAGVSGPQIAWASGDVTANGGSALIASAASTAKPADTLAAYCGESQLPSAAPGSVVRDGVAPK